LTGISDVVIFRSTLDIPYLNKTRLNKPYKEETMDFRGLYKWAGVCAIGYAVISLVGYFASVATNGAVSVTPLSPDQIWNMLQKQGNRIALRLDQLSYFLWIPALVGLFAFLRDHRPGRAHLGGAFAALAVIGFFAASTLGGAMLALAQQPATEALRERLAAFDLVSFSLVLPALYAISVANLLWGLALRTQAGLAKTVGALFLIQVAAFVVGDAGFISRQAILLNAGIMIHNLAIAATYATAGVLLRRASLEALEVKPIDRERGRTASASA
jgi:hypothetical protein